MNLIIILIHVQHAYNDFSFCHFPLIFFFFIIISLPPQQEIVDREPLISPNVDEFYKINQAMGPKRSHWSALKKRRDERIEYCVIETNKLLVRLDKLLKEAPQGKNFSSSSITCFPSNVFLLSLYRQRSKRS